MIAHKKAAETNVEKTERNTKHLPWKKVAREREREAERQKSIESKHTRKSPALCNLKK